MRLQTQSRRIIPEFAVPVAPDPVDFRELSGSPKFPGNPLDHSPCSPTPAGPGTRYGTRGQRTRHGPRTKAQRGLLTVANFGAQSHGFWSRCLRLEVEVTRHRARLASGCWSQLCRTGFDPQGFYERFLNRKSSSFPELHGASFVLAIFYHRQFHLFDFTGHWLLVTDHFSRPTPSRHPSYLPPGPAGSGRAQTLPRWLLHATDRPIGKGRTGPDLDERLSIFSMSPDQAIPADKLIRFFPLAAAQPLTILSWPEALNASRSRRACRMAIRRNACSLLALPDFPEFAQAVKYGVLGTPRTPLD